MAIFKKKSEKKSIPDGLWTKCPECKDIIYNKQLNENKKVCVKCGYHFRLTTKEKIDIYLDEGSFKEADRNLTTADPLNFVDSKPYPERVISSLKKSYSKEAVVTGTATINKQKVTICILDFAFMGGSMGSVVGEKITRAAERSLKNKSPLIIVSASGGARMQESILSLMQMAKTSAVLSKLSHESIPYISILTHPTTGGVTASFAMLGDVNVAEPDALIGFAGPRVIEQTIRQKLPPGFQKSAFQLKHGMIDLIVNRHELKNKVSLIIDAFTSNVKCYKSKKTKSK